MYVSCTHFDMVLDPCPLSADTKGFGHLIGVALFYSQGAF